MAATDIPLLNNLLNKGEIPAVRVEITKDTIGQLMIAIIVSAILVMMLHKIFYKK